MDNISVDKLWVNFVSSHSPEAKNELITFYLPLVKSAALRLAAGLPSHISVQDLISSGVLGLISAIEKFDPHAGIQFKTFAGLRIHGAMLDDLRSLDWVPRSVRSKAKKLQAAYNAIQQEKGRFATDEEVSEFLGISLEDLNEYVETTKVVTLVSLDAFVYNSKTDNPVPFSETLEDKSEASKPLAHLHKNELREILIKAISELSEQEKLVLTLYYFEELTLKEIGLALEVTESRVSQIHSKAVMRLRARLCWSEAGIYASS